MAGKRKCRWKLTVWWRRMFDDDVGYSMICMHLLWRSYLKLWIKWNWKWIKIDLRSYLIDWNYGIFVVSHLRLKNQFSCHKFVNLNNKIFKSLNIMEIPMDWNIKKWLKCSSKNGLLFPRILVIKFDICLLRIFPIIREKKTSPFTEQIHLSVLTALQMRYTKHTYHNPINKIALL